VHIFEIATIIQIRISHPFHLRDIRRKEELSENKENFNPFPFDLVAPRPSMGILALMLQDG